MNDEHVTHGDSRPEVGTLIDFVYGVDENRTLQIEVAVREDGKCAVFHDKPFKSDVSWLEFDLDTCIGNGPPRRIGGLHRFVIRDRPEIREIESRQDFAQ